MKKIPVYNPEIINYETITMANIACTLFGEEFLESIPFNSGTTCCMQRVLCRLSSKQIAAIHLARKIPEAQHIPIITNSMFYRCMVSDIPCDEDYQLLTVSCNRGAIALSSVEEILREQYDFSDICNSIPPIKNTCCLYKEGDSFYLLS